MNKKLFSKIAILALIMIAFACSSAQVRVMPSEDGTTEIIARDAQRDVAEEAANKAAYDYCEKKNKSPVFMKDKTKYTGKMDEQTRSNIKNASTAAMMIGGFHSPLSSAGQAGHAMTSDRDYEAKVIIKCQ